MPRLRLMFRIAIQPALHRIHTCHRCHTHGGPGGVAAPAPDVPHPARRAGLGRRLLPAVQRRLRRVVPQQHSRSTGGQAAAGGGGILGALRIWERAWVCRRCGRVRSAASSSMSA
eukprot:308649-Chlamydomonas_euryale.AAC.1